MQNWVEAKISSHDKNERCQVKGKVNQTSLLEFLKFLKHCFSSGFLAQINSKSVYICSTLLCSRLQIEEDLAVTYIFSKDHCKESSK